LFGGGGGYHVVVISDRLDGNSGKTSNNEYYINNSWGKVKNGWVNADGLACAINFGADPDHDESQPPARDVASDMLQPPPEGDKFARGDDGLDSERKREGLTAFRESAIAQSRDTEEYPDPDPADQGSYSKSADDEAAELRKSISAFGGNDKDLVEKAITCILTNKKDDGSPRKWTLSPIQQAAILHECNRLFSEESKITAQGLEAEDRNRALMAMIQDTATPDYINQGTYGTCNVTTIMKIESHRRPAAQCKRFVDMWTNANGDQTVNMPPL
jgi:hypothetical protein